MARPVALDRFNSRTVYEGCVHASWAHSIDFDNDAFAHWVLQAMKFVPKEE